MYSPNRYKSLLYEPPIRDHAARILCILNSVDVISEDKLVTLADFHINERPRIVREILKPLCKLSFVKKVRISTKRTPNQVYQLTAVGHKHYKAILSGEWDIQTKFDLETALRYDRITEWPSGSDRESHVLNNLKEIDLKLKNFPITTMRPALLLYILGGIVAIDGCVTNNAFRCLFASTVGVLFRRMVELGVLAQRVDKDATPENAVYHGPEYPFYIATAFGKEVYSRLCRYLKTTTATAPAIAAIPVLPPEETNDSIEDLSLEELEILTRPNLESKPVRYTKSSPKKLGAFDGALYLDWVTRAREDKKILLCMEQYCQSEHVSEELDVLLEDIQVPTMCRDIWARCVKTDKPYREFLQILKEYISHIYSKTESTVMQSVALPGHDEYIIDTSQATNRELCKVVYAYLIERLNTVVNLEDVRTAVKCTTDDCTTALADLARMNLIRADTTNDGVNAYAISRGAVTSDVRPMEYPHIFTVLDRMPPMLRDQCKQLIDYIVDHPHCTVNDIANASDHSIDSVTQATRILAACGILDKTGGTGRAHCRYTVSGPKVVLPLLHGTALKTYEYFKTCKDERRIVDVVTECGIDKIYATKICSVLYYAGFLERRRVGHSVKYRIADPQKMVAPRDNTANIVQPDQTKNVVQEMTATRAISRIETLGGELLTPEVASMLRAKLLDILKTQSIVSLERACQELSGSWFSENLDRILCDVAQDTPDIVVVGFINKRRVLFYHADTLEKKQVLMLLRDYGPSTRERLSLLSLNMPLTPKEIDTALEQLTQSVQILDAGDGVYKLAIGGQCDTNAGISAETPVVPGISKSPKAQMYSISGTISVSGTCQLARLTQATGIMRDLSLSEAIKLQLTHDENKTQFVVDCASVSNEDIAAFLEKTSAHACKVEIRIATVS